MAASRDLPFPLLIVCLLLIRGSSPLPTPSGDTGTTPLRPRGPSTAAPGRSPDYYSEYEDTVTLLPDTTAPVGEPAERCVYDPCLEGQTPCSELSDSSHCLCPGLTLPNEAPHAPTLKSVSWNGSEVVVRWCEPYSYVTAYVVTIGGKERQTFGKTRRSGGVGNIDHVSEVCVLAVNNAGEKGSCMMYQPRDDSLPLKAGLIGGALGFLLLLLLAVLLWRHKRQRKQQASISMHDTVETQ